MNLKQLSYINAVVRCGFNISSAAESLHTTQPGVSTQIRLLEDELGIEIFRRNGKRLDGLTPAGESIIKLAEDVLQKTRSIKQVGQEFTSKDTGTLSIATTHTQARYALPKVITRFVARYPKVQLRIRQGSPEQIAEMTLRGDVDLAIATEALDTYDRLLVLPVYRWNRSVIAHPDHPVLSVADLTLEEIARYPIITYDFAFAGRSAMSKAFEQKGLHPNIVLTALDSDVIKHYVDLGLGIGILASMAFDQSEDHSLRERNISFMFEDNITSIAIRRGHFLRSYIHEFIEMFAPHLTKEFVNEAMSSDKVVIEEFELERR